MRKYCFLSDVTGGSNLIKVEGMDIDCIADVEVERVSENDFEVVSVDLSDIRIISTYGNALPVGMENVYKSSFGKSLLAQIDDIALKLAKDLPEYEWKTEEYA